eukprot:CAMPEP_0185034640 /NCGR_PEP_ID=MMETSP1103-20130426/24698_1 /TAXON_ID=36769 /ORGANISM="Paraphysomonas bandaiensis, Strain Caron Lab Isolate" /LENGTH=272 /DNA_ID=CAMNT_0027571379 /DNA_START=226 /DNA_END=1044 /DNA_ORIENTATION=-
MRPILAALNSELAPDMEIYLIKILKILLRNPLNRRAIGRVGLSALVEALKRLSSGRPVAAGELGNAVLNACYNGENVGLFIEVGGVPPLCVLLRSRDVDVIASTLGALQGVCYVPKGRHEVRGDIQTMSLIATFLSSSDPLVRARAVGCVHNLSADGVSISALREVGCIAPLLALLREHSPEVCQAAAGTLQNMSRETASRNIILDMDATPMLLDLLFSADVQCQVASIGALMNILGPTLDEERMQQLKETLTDGLVLGAIESCVFEPNIPP